MSLKLNGSTGYLIHPAKILTAFPCSQLIMASKDDVNATVTLVGQFASGADYFSSISSTSATAKQAFTRYAGQSAAANKTTTPHMGSTQELAVAVWTSATERTIYFASDVGVTDTSVTSRDFNLEDRVMVGAQMYNNGVTPTQWLKGYVSEAHFFSVGLTAADVANLLAKTVKPEEISGWIDGWTFKEWRADGIYTSIGTTRIMTAVGGVYTAGQAHPIDRGISPPIYSNNWDSETVDVAVSNWTVQAGGAYNVRAASGIGGVAVSGANVYATQSNGNSSIYTGVGLMADMVVRTDFHVPTLETSTFVSDGHNLRAQLGNTNGYRIMPATNGTSMAIQIINYAGGTSILHTSPYNFVPTPSDVVHFESSIIGSVIEARLWKNAESRPETPTATFTNTQWLTGYPGVRHGGALGFYGTDNFVVGDGSSILTMFDPEPDVVAPIMAGSLTSSSITATGFTLTWVEASDDMAVTGYETSTDGGTTWSNAGMVLTRAITGLAPDTLYNTRVRAYDGGGNRAATPLELAVTTGPAPDVTVPVMTGVLASSLITDTGFTVTWSTATDNVAVTGYEYSINGGVYTAIGSVLTHAFTGLNSSSLYAVNIRAFDAAGNKAVALSINVTTDVSVDATLPTLVGSITQSAITQTSATIGWPVGSDNVAITGYEYSTDSGTTWIDNGNNLSVALTGLAHSTAYGLRVRAYDGGGNRSTPPLSATLTTASPAVGTLTTRPMKANLNGVLWANETGVEIQVATNTDGAPVVIKTGVSTDSNGVASFSDALIVAGTTYRLIYILASGAQGFQTAIAT